MKYLLTLLLLGLAFTVQATTLKSPLCPVDCPELIEGNTVLSESLYLLSMNPKSHLADWVTYSVEVENMGASNTTRIWDNSKVLPSDLVLEPEDYKEASSLLDYDKGHQAPMASFVGNEKWYTLNYLSNITPQKANLNRGAWVQLEKAVRKAVSFRHPLYVITGPLYEKEMSKLPLSDENHWVPSHYFKVVYNNIGESASFIMPQSADIHDSYCMYSKTVSELRRRVKFKLPATLHDSKGIYSTLGCL